MDRILGSRCIRAGAGDKKGRSDKHRRIRGDVYRRRAQQGQGNSRAKRGGQGVLIWAGPVRLMRAAKPWRPTKTTLLLIALLIILVPVLQSALGARLKRCCCCWPAQTGGGCWQNPRPPTCSTPRGRGAGGCVSMCTPPVMGQATDQLASCRCSTHNQQAGQHVAPSRPGKPAGASQGNQGPGVSKAPPDNNDSGSSPQGRHHGRRQVARQLPQGPQIEDLRCADEARCPGGHLSGRERGCAAAWRG